MISASANKLAGYLYRIRSADPWCFLYPVQCLACGGTPDATTAGLVCAACTRTLRLNTDPACRKCAAPLGPHTTPSARCRHCANLSAYFERAFAAGPYQAALRDMILRYKFNRVREAADLLAGWMSDRVPEELVENIDYVVAVPAHSDTIRARTFDHTAELAIRIARRLHRPFVAQVLSVREIRPPQHAMTSKAARFRNVEDLFTLRRPELLVEKTVLLIDDVMTSGATAAACSRTLLQSGATAVYVLVAARAVDDYV